MEMMSIEQGRRLGPLLAALAGGAPPAPPKRPLPPAEPQNLALFDLIDQLVDLNKHRRTLPVANPRSCTTTAYAMLFGTVRVYVGRDSGSTSYIRHRVQENDLVIVPSLRSRDDDYKRYELGVNVMTPDQVRNQRSRGKRYSTVYIDDPSSVFRQVPQDELVYILTHDSDQTFILLGM